MRDKTHDEFIERWAEAVKNNSEWKKHQNEFINAQYNKFLKFINELSKTEKGQKKLVELYNIKNIKGYPKLLNKIDNKTRL